MFALIFATLLLSITSENLIPKYRTIVQSTFPINQPIKIVGYTDVLWPLIPISEDQINNDELKGLRIVKINKKPIGNTHTQSYDNVAKLPPDHSYFGTNLKKEELTLPIFEPDVTFLRPTYLYVPTDLEIPKIDNPHASPFNVDNSSYKSLLAKVFKSVEDSRPKFEFPSRNYGTPVLSTRYDLPKFDLKDIYKSIEFALPDVQEPKSFDEPDVQFQRPMLVFNEQTFFTEENRLPKKSTKVFKDDPILLPPRDKLYTFSNISDDLVYGLPNFRPAFFKTENKKLRKVLRLKGKMAQTESEFGVPVLNVPKTSYDVSIY